MASQKFWTGVGNTIFRFRGQIPAVLFIIAVLFVGLISPVSPAGENLRIFVAFLVALAGMIIRIDVVGHVPPQTSGRNRYRQVADELNTTGWYSVFRHPLYVANFLLYLGPVLLTDSLVFIFVYGILIAGYYKIISLAEDDFLMEKFGDTYRKWAERTPGFVPVFTHYSPPAYPFSLKKVLINEYHMILEIPLAFTALVIARNYAATGTIRIPLFWLIVMALALICWIILEVYHFQEKRKWKP